MPDIIDIDAGPIISGEASIEQMGEAVLDLVVHIASGEVLTKAELNSQEDFIPWKRGVSLWHESLILHLRPSVVSISDPYDLADPYDLTDWDMIFGRLDEIRDISTRDSEARNGAG